MSRDRRVRDNWALLYAQQRAMEMRQPLVVVFALCERFLGAAGRHYDFMLEGLAQVGRELGELNIGFHVVTGDPGGTVPDFMRAVDGGLLVADFCPLNISREWNRRIASQVEVEFAQVDAHNIVPCFVASPKLEFAAHTFRPKIHKLLPEYLHEFPSVIRHPFDPPQPACDPVPMPQASPELKSGEQAAAQQLSDFLNGRLNRYHLRNDPNAGGCSGLSPYLHFGQISAQRVALEVAKCSSENVDAFLEELIVRRELADNFCFYNSSYDRFEGFHPWAQETLNRHRSDARAYLYGFEQFERAQTHDALWNAAQTEMVRTGGMHGYLRMYWAKKIAEWSATPEEALATAIVLNDRYQFDGRDPNGYTGIAWSVGGVHDRAWGDRPVTGKIRCMVAAGCNRKFDTSAYIRRFV